MRRAAALAALLGAGLLSGHALADGLPVPTVPSITSITSILSVTSSVPSVPSAPLPVTSTPSLPTPTVPTATTPVPRPTTSGLPSSGPSSPAGSVGSTTGTGGATGPSAQPGGGSPRTDGGPSGQDVTRGHTSRTWITTSGTTRRPLEAGTYRVSGRTGSGRLVERVVVVVFDEPPRTAAELEAARSANVCPAPVAQAELGNGSTYAQLARRPSTAGQPSASRPLQKPDSLPGGVLGSTAAKAARAVRPMLVALLAVAIVLLGIASLPKLAFVDRRANALLAQYRLEIAALGAAAFIAVVITFLVE